MARPIRSTTQIWEVTHCQYGISILIIIIIIIIIPQTSFCREVIGHDIAKWWLFSQAKDSATFKSLDWFNMKKSFSLLSLNSPRLAQNLLLLGLSYFDVKGQESGYS